MDAAGASRPVTWTRNWPFGTGAAGERAIWSAATAAAMNMGDRSPCDRRLLRGDCHSHAVVRRRLVGEHVERPAAGRALEDEELPERVRLRRRDELGQR